VEEEQAVVGNLDALDRPSSEVRLPASRGRQPQDVVALLERIRAEDSQEPFWRGVDRLEASGSHLALDFHLPVEPRLEPVDDVSVACHLYDSEVNG
jgi:peptide/nickel transport system ATP-binding protein